MTYKSILTVLTDPADAHGVLPDAIAFAAVRGAHLDVLCVGIDRTQVGYYVAGATAYVAVEFAEQARGRSVAIEAAARPALDRSGLSFGLETVVAEPVGVSSLVARRARFADLVILPRPYDRERGDPGAEVVEAALFPGDAAILVLPGTGKVAVEPRTILIAWNESDEAMAAIRAAMPLLVAARSVDICVVDPRRHDPRQSDPGSDLCRMLVRHGVAARVTILPRTLPRVSEVLARHAVDIEADLMVMGAYGHSRLREAILGGATRELLEEAPVPVFLAH